MPRHLTLADIGRGYSRRRAPRSHRTRLLVGGCVLGLVAGCALVTLPRLPIGPTSAAAGAAGTDGTDGTGAPEPDRGRAGTSGGAGSTADAADAGSSRCTELVVAAAPDTAGPMSRFAAEFSAAGHDARGRCVRVAVRAASSGATLAALSALDAGPGRPDVWSPAGAVWLSLLADRLATAGRPALVAAGSSPRLATSALVVAMPRPMAQALGWPGRPIGWADLRLLAESPTGWGLVRHPGWGRFQLAKADPNLSAAGLEGTIATFYAASRRTSGLTADDVRTDSARRFVAGLERSVVRSGESTSALAVSWRQADRSGHALGFLSGLVTQESAVAAYNDGNPTADPAQVGRNARPRVALVAVYPKEGTFLTEYPYTVLTGGWVTPAKQAAAAAFLAYLRSPAAQRAWQAAGFRDADGVAGPQVTPAIGLLPRHPSPVLAAPDAATTKEVLRTWSQLHPARS